MVAVTYFAVPEYPGDYFACDRYGVMAVSGCVRNYKAAPEAVKNGRLDGCIGCAIGRHHVDPTDTVEVQKPTAFAYRIVCVRCRRGGSKDDTRLVGRMRLVRGHTICVSCYNREREVMHGKNAKGAPPKKWKSLYLTRVAQIRSGAMHIEMFAQPVHDCEEAIYTVLRRAAAEKLVVGWTSHASIERGAA